MLMALPMAEMVEMVSTARPPRASATKGTKSVPDERQAERLEAMQLALDAYLKSMARSERSLRHSLLLERTDDMDI